MDEINNVMAKVFHRINQYEENIDKNMEACLKQLDGIIKNAVDSQKPANKKPKRIVKPIKIEEEESNWSMENTLNVSRRLPRASKTKGIQKAKLSQGMKLKVPVVEIKVLCDKDISEYTKSIKTKIKKENLLSPPRRVTRASSRGKNISGSSCNGSNLSGSVEIIPEEDLVITISEDEANLEKGVTQKNTRSKKKSSPQIEAITRLTRSKVNAVNIENDLVPLEQTEKRVTRSTKSQKVSSSPKENKSSSDASFKSLSNSPESIPDENRKNSLKNIREGKRTSEKSLPMDNNNNENDKGNRSSQKIFENAKMSTDPVSNDQSKHLENTQQQSRSNETFAIAANIPNNETFATTTDIPSNSTFVQPIVDSTFDVPESTFIIDRKLPKGGETNENIAPAGSGATSSGSGNKIQKADILNSNFPIVKKGKEYNQQKDVPVIVSKVLKQNNNTAALRIKNTGAIPKLSSKQIKDAGTKWKTPTYSNVLNKACSASKAQCKETALPSKYGGKKQPHSATSVKETQREEKIVKNQPKVDADVQQEHEYLHRLEAKRREIEMKEKLRKEKAIMQEQYIKTVVQKIQERKQNESEEKKKYDFTVLNSGDSTDEEDKVSMKKSAPPVWSMRQERRARIETQTFMPHKVIDTFFSTAPLNPDLQEIFPSINPNRLKRNSSIFWNTPPRYSQLPKY